MDIEKDKAMAPIKQISQPVREAKAGSEGKIRMIAVYQA